LILPVIANFQPPIYFSITIMKALQVSALLAMSAFGCAIPVNPSSSPDYEAKCRNIVLPIQAQSQNKQFPPYPNSTAPGVLYQYLASYNASTLPLKLVQGSFKISATFCGPTVQVKGRENTIQVLLHGLSATKVR
jgi:hypothetical protein